jgi:putative heme-binding domain-containing protein
MNVTAIVLLWMATVGQAGGQAGPGIEQQLLGENREALVKEALRVGDPVRGAIVFYQPYMTCTKCHSAGEEVAHPLGPDLTRLEKGTTPALLVESILEPSKVIRKGFEPVSVLLQDGTTISGIVVEQTDKEVVLRDVAQEGRTVSFSREQIDEVTMSKTSIMPAGLVNQLAGRQQFLDLVAYLAEIAAKGPSRALELKPAPALYALPPLPEYEQHIDHRAMIAGFDTAGLKRGEAIYRRVCANCHGTHDQPGSLPNSPRFASGKFKNGSDPFAMYQTLTRGFGMMVPQTWMVPQQKYDVIHYIREAYLKPHNRSLYASIDKAYLARLPKGNTRGPAPLNIEPWVAMDYGPSLINTYEIGNDGSNFAYKGIAVRLDPGPGGVSRGREWTVFDHDTLRVAATWTTPAGSKEAPFIDWQGIHFDGQHQVHPHVSGEIEFANPNGPGFGNPETGSFEDPRPRGRDGRPYGPLPREWAHYRGIYACGPQTVISYTVGSTPILELFSSVSIKTGESSTPVYARTWHIGPRTKNLNVLVATHADVQAQLAVMTVKDNGQREIAVFAGRAANGPRDDSRRATLVAGLEPAVKRAVWSAGPNGRLMLTIPSGKEQLDFTMWQSRVTSLKAARELAVGASRAASSRPDLVKLTQGGPKRWPEILKTVPALGKDGGPFAVDVLVHPVDNPWLAQMRPTGFDFFDDGDAVAVCTWDGDVWMVKGLKMLPAARDANPKPTAVRSGSGRTAAGLGGESVGASAPSNLWGENSPSPRRGGGSDFGELSRTGWGGESRLTFPPPSQPSPIKGEGAQFFDGSLAFRDCSESAKQGDERAEAPEKQPAGQAPELSWQRIASGLFQPLGLKIVGGKIHVTCRDQLVILHDLNGDGETDFYENFNNDHQVTDHFHEFAMGLQVDADGNFYYAKSARHALPAVVPHHGTLLRVSRDGSHTDTLATGFRAANGVCLNPDGTFIVTDQEGHWNPKNRINWVKPGGFYGNMFGFHDVTDPSDSAMEQPVCWITNSFDRSPAELLWVPGECWGPLGGKLLNLSYGYGKIYVVPHENAGGHWQGGMCALPVPTFPTGIMRGRFHPDDGQLYVCGMFAWAGSATKSGGFYRVRYTGRPVHVPVALNARASGMAMTFAAPLERASATDAGRYAVKIWGLKRTANYGSDHYNEHSLAVKAASLSDDGKTVQLEIPEIGPTWCMEIKYSLRGANGEPVNGVLHNTVHRVGE